MSASEFRGRHVTDPLWIPPSATVGMARDEREAKAVRQLRYRVYVHEQGRQLDGVDRERGELVDPLDPRSCLWYARDDDRVVGTLTQMIIGSEFDLSRLPSALALHAFPRTDACPLGFSSRFVIAPGHRSTWVLPALTRYSYAYGRALGGTFDFMATNPGLVPLFERLGYVRYTTAAIYSHDIGLLLPMVLPATDHEHLRKVRSACLACASCFPDEPEWGEWLRAAHPIIGIYYGSHGRDEQIGCALAERIGIPRAVGAGLSAMSFVHHFPRGTLLRRTGDRVTYAFVALEGQISLDRVTDCFESTVSCAPDGVAYARATIRCHSDAVVCCVPDMAVARVMRRHPEHAAELRVLLEESQAGQSRAAIFR